MSLIRLTNRLKCPHSWGASTTLFISTLLTIRNAPRKKVARTNIIYPVTGVTYKHARYVAIWRALWRAKMTEIKRAFLHSLLILPLFELSMIETFLDVFNTTRLKATHALYSLATDHHGQSHQHRVQESPCRVFIIIDGAVCLRVFSCIYGAVREKR